MTSDRPNAPSPGALTHTALLYRAPKELRVAVRDFAAAAAADGEPLLAVLPAHSLSLLDDVLARSGAELTRVDVAEAGRNPGRLIPLVLAWLADQPGPARIISEATWPGRRDAELTEVLRHEALLNHVLADEPASLLCPFDAARLDGEVLAGAEMTHPWLIDETGRRPSERYGDPLELARGGSWPQTDPRPPVSELVFEGDLWALRRSLEQTQLLARLEPERREDYVCAVNEAASNAIRHGDGTCRARMWREEDRVVSEIVTPTQIGDPLAGRRPPDPEGLGGRGLWLINRLCDLVEIRSGPAGASVRMHVTVG